MLRRSSAALLLAVQLACAGRAATATQLSRQPRGTDVSLLPSSIALLPPPGALSLQLMRPAYVTVFEQLGGLDSLRLAFATGADTIGVLDGTVTIRVDAAVRSILAADAGASPVQESCVVVQRAAGDRGLPLCGANAELPANRRGVPAARWRFTRSLVLLATEERYRGADRIPMAWFYRVDGTPPGVSGGWGALPLGAPLQRVPPPPTSR